MAKTNLLPIERLHELLRLDDESWRTYWRVDRGRRLKAGTEALASVRYDGYRYGTIDGKQFYAHRVIWALHYGEWPTGVVDHIDGDPSNNRVENLRDVAHSTNLRNTFMQRNNTSGVTGVHWFKQYGCWTGRIRGNGVDVHLGYFDTFEAACEARWAAEKQYGYTNRHGERRSA